MRRRRLWLTLGIVVVLLATVAAGGWYVWLPSFRPSLHDGERYGIDVSSHQDTIAWAEVADDDIEFAYIKATEGRDFLDARFAFNWSGARRSGIDRGAYHFFTLCSPGADQARHFLTVAEPDPSALPPAVDLELAGNCSARPAAGDVADQLDEFVELVEQAWGRPMVLYVGDDWDHRYPSRERLSRDLWHFRFLRRPDVDGWTIWQVHGFAHVLGIGGRVDLNVMR